MRRARGGGGGVVLASIPVHVGYEIIGVGPRECSRDGSALIYLLVLRGWSRKKKKKKKKNPESALKCCINLHKPSHKWGNLKCRGSGGGGSSQGRKSGDLIKVATRGRWRERGRAQRVRISSSHNKPPRPPPPLHKYLVSPTGADEIQVHSNAAAKQSVSEVFVTSAAQ